VKTVAIMQPTYLPWIGYFSLMDQSDIFIFLDSVQFDKRSWQQRNRIKTAQGEKYLTVPVLTKGRGNQKICEVEIDESQNFVGKHLRTIENVYSKAPFFTEYWDAFSSLLNRKHMLLADLNIDLIQWFKDIIGIKVEFEKSTKFNPQGNKVELLVNLCNTIGADKYLSPQGSKSYIEKNNLFDSNKIELEFQQYTHPMYRQSHNVFIPYLSILDLIMNEGSNSLSIIRSGQK
jgi:hypothetical protein